MTYLEGENNEVSLFTPVGDGSGDISRLRRFIRPYFYVDFGDRTSRVNKIDEISYRRREGVASVCVRVYRN